MAATGAARHNRPPERTMQERTPLMPADETRQTPAKLSPEQLFLLAGLARIFHRSRATNEYGIALVCPKIQVSNFDQRAGNAEAKLYRRN